MLGSRRDRFMTYAAEIRRLERVKRAVRRLLQSLSRLPARPSGLRLRVERVTGIEPAWPAWKAGALPLSYTRETVGGNAPLAPTSPADQDPRVAVRIERSAWPIRRAAQARRGWWEVARENSEVRLCAMLTPGRMSTLGSADAPDRTRPPTPPRPLRGRPLRRGARRPRRRAPGMRRPPPASRCTATGRRRTGHGPRIRPARRGPRRGPTRRRPAAWDEHGFAVPGGHGCAAPSSAYT